MKVISIGEILWDVFPDHRVWGGAPANFTFHASQLGAEALMVSALGKDHLGKELRDAVQEAGLALSAIEVDAPTGQSIISLDSKGNPEYEIVMPCSWDFIQLNQEAKSFLKEADLICFGALAQRHEISQNSILNAISDKKPGAKVMFDVNIRQHYYNEAMIRRSLQMANILKLNEVELKIFQEMFGITPEKIREVFDLDMIILTMGEQGSTVFTLNETSDCPVHPCQVVDAVGAGDAFGAAMVINILSGMEIKRAQIFASKVAAYVCEHAGATVVLPDTLINQLKEGVL